MTNLRTKIIAGVLGVALTTTVGATAVMHNQNKAEEVKAEMTTTTTTSDKEFIPVKTESKPEIISRGYNVKIEVNDIDISEVTITNSGLIIITYSRDSIENSDKPAPMPTSMSIVDDDGTKGRIFAEGYPQIGFEGINPLSQSFTLTIAFEDLEEQTIEIVLPDEYTQK